MVVDDIAQAPKREYKKVLLFLKFLMMAGLNSLFIIVEKLLGQYFLGYTIRNLANAFYIKQLNGLNKELKIGSWILYKFNKKSNEKVTLSNEMKKKRELCNYFKDDIKLLEKLLNRDFSHWLEV